MKQTLLIIGYVWPEPSSSAAGTRMMQLIHLFQKHGWLITFASPAKLGEHREDLTLLGIKEQNIKLNSSSFDDFLNHYQPNAVIFDRFMMEEQFGWRVEKQCPNALRILNTEDLHSLRDARQHHLKTQLKQQSSRALEGDLACGSKKDITARLDLASLWNQSSAQLFNLMADTDLAQREIAAILRCDLTLMISKFESNLLETVFKIDRKILFTLPFIYKKFEQALPSFEQRQPFVFIGNFRHAPNWDSVLWLKETIWPEIRNQLPQAELHVYGAYPAKKVTNLHNPKQGFLVKGWAPDALNAIANARILLSPLRFGAGIKGKLAEAMLCGTPSITTPIGSEAMLPDGVDNHLWPGFIGETEQQLIEQSVALYQDENSWHQKQQTGFQMGAQLYQQSTLGDDFIKKISHTQNQLEQHRKQNFIGAMLRHHHHKSTQYMSQWIQAKNKNGEIEK